MGKREEAFIRSILAGSTWREAASGVGLPEDRARSFLESVAGFAGAVTAQMEFGVPEQPARASGRGTHDELVVYTDGASNGNPGPSGAGGVIMTPAGEILEEFHESLGTTTNNVAEYEAVRFGLTRALELGARKVTVRLDSELVANQLAGRYKVKDTKLIDRYLEVGKLISKLEFVSFETIPRSENAHADRLAQVGARKQ
jgi:ribonuclease HI